MNFIKEEGKQELLIKERQKMMKGNIKIPEKHKKNTNKTRGKAEIKQKC